MAKLGDAATWSGGKIRDVGAHLLQLTASKQPYNAMVRKGRRVFNSTPEWPYATEPAADITPLADGADVASADFADYESLFGMLQGRAVWKRRAFSIGKKAQLMTQQYGGVKDKFKQYGILSIKALSKDMETINMGSQDSYRETVSSQPRDQSRGIYRWLGGTATPTDLSIPSAARNPAGNKVTTRATVGAVTEDDVRGVMKSIADTTYQEDGNYVLFCNTGFKQVFSNYSAVSSGSTSAILPLRRFNTDASKKTITLDVTAYEGDFGKLKLHPHFYMPSGTSSYATVYAATADNGLGRAAADQKMDAALAASLTVYGYLINLDYTEVNMVQAPMMGTLPDMGGGPQGYVDAIWVHSILNPQAHGYFGYVTP